ncbi:hypothetical protein ACNS7O_00905 [Haloferacaceae archaeon DSL9]
MSAVLQRGVPPTVKQCALRTALRGSRLNGPRRSVLESLLATPSPSGFEADGQRVWIDDVDDFADELGFIVRDIVDRGYLRTAPIGGSGRTVSKGQHAPTRIPTARFKA